MIRVVERDYRGRVSSFVQNDLIRHVLHPLSQAFGKIGR